MRLGTSLLIALIVIMAINAYLSWLGIPQHDGVYQRYCVDGVSYLHFTNGPVIQRDPDGKVVTCEINVKK